MRAARPRLLQPVGVTASPGCCRPAAPRRSRSRLRPDLSFEKFWSRIVPSPVVITVSLASFMSAAMVMSATLVTPSRRLRSDDVGAVGEIGDGVVAVAIRKSEAVFPAAGQRVVAQSARDVLVGGRAGDGVVAEIAEMVSLPLPPIRRLKTEPSPASMESLPPLPSIQSMPPAPSMVSSASVPKIHVARRTRDGVVGVGHCSS